MINFQGGVPYHFHQFYWVGLDLLFPGKCAGCGALGSQWCHACRSRVKRVGVGGCWRCARPALGPECDQCLQMAPAYDRVRSFGFYQSPLSNAIVDLKYHARGGLGERLAADLIALLQQLNWQIDLVTAVPLGRQRLKERGYNQAEQLARPIGRYFKIPYSRQTIRRSRETSSQVGLDARERNQNVSKAFKAERNLVSERRVLLVDDVFTTGATLNSCAVALKRAGAKSVVALTLARAADPSQVFELEDGLLEASLP